MPISMRSIFYSSCNRFHKKKHSFTLVELLVLVGIITLLLTLFFPAFSRIRETTRRLQCMTNLHEIGLAERMYAADNSGKFYFFGEQPPVGDRGNYTSNGRYWWGLSNYLASFKLLYCPSALIQNVRGPDWPDFGNNRLPLSWAEVATVQNHYGYMYYMTTAMDPKYILAFECPNFYFHTGDFPNPRPGPIVSEGFITIQMQTGTAFAGWGDGVFWGPGCYATMTAHAASYPDGNAGSNLLFVDGRVEWQVHSAPGFSFLGPFYGYPLPNFLPSGISWPYNSQGVEMVY